MSNARSPLAVMAVVDAPSASSRSTTVAGALPFAAWWSGVYSDVPPGLDDDRFGGHSLFLLTGLSLLSNGKCKRFEIVAPQTFRIPHMIG